MRLRNILGLAAAALAVAFAAAPQPAEAGGTLREARPAGFDRVRVVRHWVYRPRYVHHYAVSELGDPYAYYYEPRGYYPYYNSGYWVPRCCYTRPAYPYRIPAYYKAWGANKKGYHHYKWHAKHHGRHWHHHW